MNAAEPNDQGVSPSPTDPVMVSPLPIHARILPVEAVSPLMASAQEAFELDRREALGAMFDTDATVDGLWWRTPHTDTQAPDAEPDTDAPDTDAQERDQHPRGADALAVAALGTVRRAGHHRRLSATAALDAVRAGDLLMVTQLDRGMPRLNEMWRDLSWATGMAVRATLEIVPPGQTGTTGTPETATGGTLGDQTRVRVIWSGTEVWNLPDITPSGNALRDWGITPNRVPVEMDTESVAWMGAGTSLSWTSHGSIAAVYTLEPQPADWAFRDHLQRSTGTAALRGDIPFGVFADPAGHLDILRAAAESGGPPEPQSGRARWLSTLPAPPMVPLDDRAAFIAFGSAVRLRWLSPQRLAASHTSLSPTNNSHEWLNLAVGNHLLRVHRSVEQPLAQVFADPDGIPICELTGVTSDGAAKLFAPFIALGLVSV